MKTALDYYDRGKIKESNADDYNSSSYYAKGRFICPECGEPVHIRPSKYSNFFVHYKRTNENDECDRRVDGENTESIYERMGIPLYLRTDDDKQFFLYMGFKILPESILTRAENEKAVLSVDQTKRYAINRERFSQIGTTLLPVDYVPLSNHNYCFSITPLSISNTIEKYWSNYADGFTYEGGLFTVTDRGGRKIRHGDNIATETEYYWVRRQNQIPTYYKGIEMKLVGKLILRNNTWNVFKGFFSSEIDDSEYRSLTNYLRDSLRVHLIEKVPEVLPLWPPIIKSEEGYLYKNGCKKIYGRVVSGNDDPKAYLYRDVSTVPEDLKIQNGIVEVYTRNSNIVVNIDRKYISGGSSFTVIDEYSVKGLAMPYSEFENNTLRISGVNSKSVLIYRINGEILEIKNEEEIELVDLKDGDWVLIIGSNHIFLSMRIVLDKIAVNSGINEKELLYFMKKYQYSKKVILPHKLRKKIKTLNCCEKEILTMITAILDGNEIGYPLIKVMEGYLDGKN